MGLIYQFGHKGVDVCFQDLNVQHCTQSYDSTCILNEIKMDFF